LTGLIGLASVRRTGLSETDLVPQIFFYLFGNIALIDRTSFGRGGAGWFWWSRRRGFSPDGPATGPFATSYAAYRHVMNSGDLTVLFGGRSEGSGGFIQQRRTQMPVLESFSFTALPKSGNDPIQTRLAKFVAKLEEQKLRLKHVRTVQRWTKVNGERQATTKQ
jgi:hypothetical protein